MFVYIEEVPYVLARNFLAHPFERRRVAVNHSPMNCYCLRTSPLWALSNESEYVRREAIPMNRSAVIYKTRDGSTHSAKGFGFGALNAVLKVRFWPVVVLPRTILAVLSRDMMMVPSVCC